MFEDWDIVSTLVTFAVVGAIPAALILAGSISGWWDMRKKRTAHPASWFPDPAGRHQLRYWDGTRWTEHVSDHGTTTSDPLH